MGEQNYFTEDKDKEEEAENYKSAGIRLPRGALRHL